MKKMEHIFQLLVYALFVLHFKANNIRLVGGNGTQVFNINITDVSGVITSPGYPHYIQRAQYVWTFRPPVPNADIAIYFEDVDLVRRIGYSSVDMRDSSGYQYFYLSNTRASPLGTVIQNKKNITISFYSSLTSVGKGVLVRYLVLDCPLNDAIEHDASIMASSSSPHSISVAFSSFTVDGFQVLGYLITCNSTDDWHSTVSYAIADNRTKNGSCHGLVGLTNYRVQVFAVGTNVSDGRMMTYKSRAMQITTMEGVPSDFPRGLRTSSPRVSTIHLQWNPIPRDRVHGVLLGYRIQYYVHYGSSQRRTINTTDTQITLANLLPGMNYYINVCGFTSQGLGPDTSITSVTKCGGIEQQALGAISHPRYGGSNGWTTKNCTWTLKSPSKTGLIIISLELVDFLGSTRCGLNFVALFDNKGQMSYKICRGQLRYFTFASIGMAQLQSYTSRFWFYRGRLIMKAKYYILNSGFDDVHVEPSWNISVQTINSSAINVQWSEYPLSSNMAPHTRVVSYVAVCIAVKTHTNISVASTDGQGRRVNVTHLESYTEYYVQVIAVLGNTINSTSVNETAYRRSRNITVRTMKGECGGIEQQALGTISHPWYGGRDGRTKNCMWTFKSRSKTGMIIISVEFVHFFGSSGCWLNFVALFDNKGQMSYRICRGQLRYFTFASIGMAQLQSYTRQYWYHRGRLMMRAKYYIFNSGFDNVHVEPSWNINVRTLKSSAINVQWSEYPLSSDMAPHTGVVSYVAVCIAVKNHTDISAASNGLGRSVNFDHLEKYTEYYVQVIAVLGNAINSSLRRSINITLRTMEKVPSQPPLNVVARLRTSDNILVKWDPIPNEYVPGVLLGYRVYYQPTSSSNGIHERMVFVHANTSVLLENLGFLTEYRIRVTGVTRAGEGPRSRAVFLRTGLDCDKDLSGRHGQFSSPNYPSNYPEKADCAWTIGKRMKFYEIMILFDTFEMEKGHFGICSNDYVRIVDVKGNELGEGKYCGKKNPFAVVSPRSAQVILHSDRAFQKIGFNASYYVLDSSSKGIDLKVKYFTTSELMLDIKDLGVKFANIMVLYKEKEGQKTWKVSSASSNNILIQGLLPSKEYEVRAVGYYNGKVYKSQVVTNVTQLLPVTSPTEKTTPPTTEPLKQMYDYGPSAGDSVVPHAWGDLQKCFGIDLSEDGITILMKRYHRLYICHNGVIRFGAHFFPRWPKPFSGNTDGCNLDLAMLAPYWATTDPYSFYPPKISAVYYHVYTASQQNPVPISTIKSIQVLDRATSDVHRLYRDPLPEQFKASLVVVVTWYNLRHLNLNNDTRSLYNTFQAVIITDGVYTFAMYNYPQDGIEWSAPIARAKWRLYTKGNSANDPLPVVGWSAGCRQGEYFNTPRSGEVTIGDIAAIDGKTVFRKRGPGGKFKQINHGIKGKWLFRLETSSGQRSERNCRRWFKRQPDPRPYLEYLEPCPCTFIQARWDERFEVQPDWRGKSKVCAYSTFTSIDGWQQECCYFNDRRSSGALIVGHPGGGSALKQKYVKNRITSDYLGYDMCCVQSTLCHLYYKRRPSDNCMKYDPPEWSLMWGDPHFVTLDGKNYTFNGLGEYVMLDAKDGFFQLQARTRLAKGDGTATVFCATVAKETNTSKVQINLEKEGNMTLFVDGETMDYYSLTNESTRLNGSVVVSRPKDDTFRATFPSGISVTVRQVKGALSILLAMPLSFRNKTKGLLGTWNGDQTDDLATPNGDVLPANASSKDIHFYFGQKWQVNDHTSLFTYQLGENVSTFSNMSFVPMFIDDLQFYNDTLKQQAYAACEGDINCLFDAASTKDVSVGLSTKIVGSQMVNESNALKNSPPRFDNTSAVLYLTVNISNSVIFTAKDPDGDRIRLNITGLPDDATVLANESSITIEWTVTMQSVTMEIVATDSRGASSVLRPELHVCACHNGGNCFTSNQGDEVDRNNSRFSIMSCQCASGYTGRFCESDIDACEVNMNPCYPGVQCKDLAAPANVTGYECGPCPSGFSGRGDSCSDIDECDGVLHGCDQICANTPGSYTCGCNHGYVLNRDGRTCDDVNECDPASDCMQGCVNTPGSYRCTCNQYFTVDPTNAKRCIPESPCKDSNHQCQHICYVSNGTDHCTCRPGYELQNDGQSCSDIDECTTGKNRCNQDCRNTIGWYDCECRLGYRLDTDYVTCIDIDECLEWTFNCSSNQRCHNTIGSYECECRKGLVWNGNECQEPEKPTTRPPSTPRPSEKDVQNSVNVTIQGLNINEWDQEKDLKFKNAVAMEATKFCVEARNCFGPKTRVRRSTGITFTAQEVHLLPGYPVQLSYSSIPDHVTAVVAFYVKFPPGVAIGVTDTVDKDLLVGIVNGSLARIGRAINKTILSVSMHMVEQPLTTITTTRTTAVPTTDGKAPETRNDKLLIIIVGSVAWLIVLIIIVAVVIKAARRNHTASFKLQVALEMKGEETLDKYDLSQAYEMDNRAMETDRND